MRYMLLFWIGFMALGSCQNSTLPEGFSNIDDYLPDLVVELRYATDQNFMGRKVVGYDQPKVVLTTDCLKALKEVQKELYTIGLGLKLFDGYRPQKAVNYFMQWATQAGDTLTKRQYYPDLAKSTLFEAGYIAERSGHSRGSTVDITLIYRQGPRKGQALDMGGPWDFFGPRSWFAHPELLPEQKRNRTLLKDIMQKHGFRPYSKEWWHFTLDNEPFPDTYFDF